MTKEDWETKPLYTSDAFHDRWSDALDNIENALVEWDEVKTENNLGPDIIAQGNTILREGGIKV